MKVHSFGAENAPVILLLPGTCCHWKGNFGRVIPLLSDSYRVLCVSYDGFDETEHAEFPTMLEETAKIEAYISEHCGRHIRAAYGCSLGGSFVGLLAARRNIHMDYGILGSSDLDQTSPLAAKLQTNLLLPLLYPVIRDGKIKSRLLQKRLEKRKSEMGGYVQAFMEMLGGARLYVTMQSCKNQFYSDLVTPLPDKIDVPGTEIHIFYALKMGEKYRARYEQHFARPVIHEQDLQHEELLACYPERWAQLVKDIMEGKAMKHQHFDVETAGFYGAYWACAGGPDCAVIAMIGDDPEDRLARSAAKWLCGRGVNVLTMSPAKKDYGHHNYPLERIEAAISWLKANGNQKIGIAGASTTGTLALTAAAMFPDITLTIATTPSDFVAGFHAGQKGRLQGMAGRGRVAVLIPGQAAALYALLLSAP